VEAFKIHLPEHHALFNSKLDDYGTERETAAIEEVFSECKAISIDYGVMERADNVFVHSGDFGWSDIGTWGSLYQHSRKDKYANAKPAEGCYTYDTRNTIISLPKDKVAVISGLRDYIVVDTEDVLMICPRSEEQNIKKYIDEVKFNQGDMFS
jgi:mannose-1-phosphate guanylyltransferase